MTELKNRFITIDSGGHEMYGGDQGSLGSRAMTRCGCGLIAALNVLLYLHIYHEKYRTEFFGEKSDPELSMDEFVRFSVLLRKKFIPLFYPFGLNGLTLAWCINRYFRKYRLPLRCRWAVRKKRRFEAVEEMLSRDIPVILSIGPNFPFLLGKKGLALYRDLGTAHPVHSATVNAHYVTVTAMDEKKLRISSWGKEYYINREEFESYSHRCSWSFLSNIVSIREKKK